MITGNGYGSGSLYDGRLLYDGAPLYRATKFYSTGSDIPDGAAVYWDFKQIDTDEAQIEQVGGVNLLISSCDSNRNIIQSRDNSIITYTENEPAFNKGVGLRDEGEATTQIPTDMELWGTQFNLTPSYDSGSRINTITASGGTSQHYMAGNSAVTIGLKYVTTLEVYKGDHQFIQVTSSAGFEPVPYNIINFDLVNGVFDSLTIDPEALTMVDLGDRYKITIIDTAFSTNASARYLLAMVDSLAAGRIAPASINGAQIRVRYYNFVQASFASSPINAPTMPDTRAASNNQIPCILGAGSWRVGGVVAGEFNNVDFVNGYSRTQGRLLFFGNNGGAGGTFEGLLAAAMVGGRLHSNGSTLRIDSLATAVQLGVTLLNGDHADFEGLQPMVFELITSDYWTGDFAADTSVLDTLMDDAGYDVPSLGVAEQWPANGFSLESNLNWRGDDGVTADNRMLDATFDADNSVLLYLEGPSNPKRVKTLIEVGGVSFPLEVDLTSDIEFDDNVISRVSLATGNSMTFYAENVTKGESETAGPIAAAAITNWPATAQLCKTSALTNYINADTATTTINQLTEDAGDFDFGDFDENDFG